MINPNKAKSPRYDQFVFKAMNRMGYNAATVGQLELDRGTEYVRELAPQLDCPVVVSNAKATAGETPWRETAIVTVGGRKFGILGLVSQDFGSGKEALEDAGWTIEDPMAAVARLLPELEKQSDVTIALAHLQAADLDRLVREGKGIDLVIAGLNPHPMNTQPDDAVTAILRPGQRGEYIGVARITPGAGGGPVTVDGLEAVMLEMNKYPDDPELAAELEALKKEVDAETRKAQIERELKAQDGLILGQDRYLGNETCARCHSGEIDWWNSDPHAKAFATLEKEGKQSDSACLRCHVTGYEQPGGFGGIGTTANMKSVQCESCHGMGTLHDWTGKSASVPGEATCRACHVAEWSPDFEYGAYLKRLGHGTK